MSHGELAPGPVRTVGPGSGETDSDPSSLPLTWSAATTDRRLVLLGPSDDAEGKQPRDHLETNPAEDAGRGPDEDAGRTNNPSTSRT
jgi:hypothetical protein